MKTYCDKCGNEIDLTDMPNPTDKEIRNKYNEIAVLCTKCREMEA